MREIEIDKNREAVRWYRYMLLVVDCRSVVAVGVDVEGSGEKRERFCHDKKERAWKGGAGDDGRNQKGTSEPCGVHRGASNYWR